MSTENGAANNGNQNQGRQALTVQEKNIADNVLNRINQLQEMGEIVLPPNYIPANALKAAWLVLLETVNKDKKPALEVCTKESIANALYEMVVRGLSVVKKQCYFVVYGSKLELEESYIGKIAQAKRDANVKEVNAVTIYKDDVFEYSIDLQNGGRKTVTKHEQKLQNIDPTKIIGAYAIITYNDDTTDTEIMTFAQIQKAWQQGAAGGNSPAHKNFPDQMAEKTVISRALKIPVSSSDDSELMKPDRVSAGIKEEIDTHANRQELSIEEPIQEADVVHEENRSEAVTENTTNGTLGPDF